jgi:hypothetical protein
LRFLVSVIKKIPAQHFRDAEDGVPMGDLPQDISAEPLPELDHPFLVTRWAGVTCGNLQAVQGEVVH